MNREQIIQMARDAGFFVDGSIIRDGEGYNDQTEIVNRFAAAIRAATKEEDAKICEEEIESWERVTSSCVDEKTALRIAAKAIIASK